MRAKQGKWGWPRLHLSTAVILFLSGSVGLGLQFFRHQAVNTVQLNNGGTALLIMGGHDRPYVEMEDGFHPEYAFGLPFAVLITGVHYEDYSKAKLERCIRRRRTLLNPPPDNV